VAEIGVQAQRESVFRFFILLIRASDHGKGGERID